ncbi:hypothetical protein [Paenibacillus sp. HJGM_3]|uniref:hypothetical protein n=1 Tax=Paenibacillus sp. HJGM_3 TaxID=3379816 RepID=UPI0038599C73
MGMDAYKFADLSVHPEVVRDIQALEHKLKEQLGETITLIAFESKRNDAPASSAT